MATTYERHPLSAQYEDLQGQEWLDFVAGFEDHGFDPSRPITLYEGKVLDGWQRYRVCQHLGITPEFSIFVGENAQAFVDSVNLHRRQLSAQERQRRTNDRRDRVEKLRAAGESLRIISAKTGKSVSQTVRDLRKAGVPPGTVDKVRGKDGKTRPAEKLKVKQVCKPCVRCKKQGYTSYRGTCPVCLDIKAAFDERIAKAEAKVLAKKQKAGFKSARKEAEAIKAFFEGYKSEAAQRQVQTVVNRADNLIDAMNQLWNAESAK